jgi:hypothetical protein
MPAAFPVDPHEWEDRVGLVPKRGKDAWKEKDADRGGKN